MKMIHAFIFQKHKGQVSGSADIEVEGLGTVKIENCFSAELIAQIEKEAIFNLRVKMGLPVDTVRPEGLLGIKKDGEFISAENVTDIMLDAVKNRKGEPQ